MDLAKKRFARIVMSVAVAGSIALSGQPAAVALDVVEHTTGHASKDIMMPFPLGGEHKVKIGASSVCSWPSGKGNEPVRQTLAASMYDLDAPKDGNFLNPMQYIPFNSITVDWVNKNTNASGTKTARSNGGNADVGGIETGLGDMDVKVTVTRSMLPIFFDDFPLSSGLSTTHSESFFVKGIDPVACEAAPG